MKTDRCVGYDDFLVADYGAPICVETAAIDRAVKLLDRTIEDLERCDRALGGIEMEQVYLPPGGFETDVAGPLPNQTWSLVLENVERARTSTAGTHSLRDKTKDLQVRMRAVSQLWEQQENRIASAYARGKAAGTDIANLLTLGPVTSIPLMFAPASEDRAQKLGSLVLKMSAHLSGGVAAGAGIALNTVVARSAHNAKVVAEVSDILLGYETLSSSFTAEELAATLYGSVDGSAQRIPNLVAMLVLGGQANISVIEDAVNNLDEVDVADYFSLNTAAFSVTKVKSSYRISPANKLSDLTKSIDELYKPEFGVDVSESSQVSVEVITQPDGTQTAIVAIPGMAYAAPHEHHPNDGPASVRAMQGAETAQSKAVKEALAQLDLPPGTEIVLAGHSKGGMDALNLATDPEIQAQYNVTAVVTFGSPVETLEIQDLKIAQTLMRDLPRNTEFLHVSHYEDIVPGLDMSPPQGRGNQTEIRTEARPVLPEFSDNPVIQSHEISTYHKTAKQHELMRTPAADSWLEAASPVLGKTGARSEKHVFAVKKTS